MRISYDTAIAAYGFPKKSGAAAEAGAKMHCSLRKTGRIVENGRRILLPPDRLNMLALLECGDL